MASNGDTGPVTAGVLLQRKLVLARDMLDLTAREVVLVDLDGLGVLLERKDALISQIMDIDVELEKQPTSTEEHQGLQEEYTEVVEAILENERTFEERIQQERLHLRSELRELEQETRLRRYLEGGRRKGGSLDLKH